MHRLYQWLSERASFFRDNAVGHGASSTVRTETSVRQEAVTLLVCSAATLGLDVCPLCGSKLTPKQSGEAGHRLGNGSISGKPGPVDIRPR